MTMQTINNGNDLSEAFFGLNDPTKQSQLYSYLENLKKDDVGWRRAIESIINNLVRDPGELFLLLQVVEDYLKRRYISATIEEINIIHAFLAHWIQQLVSNDSPPQFMCNKMAHIFSLVFAIDFPTRWPRFLQEVFLDRGITNVNIVLFYLNTLLAIDKEVVDRNIVRSKEVFDRNTKIKDAMRDLCIKDAVESWFLILETTSDPKLHMFVFDVVAVFVDWIDVELIANERFVPLLIKGLSNYDTAEQAISTVEGLVQKGMPAQKKLSLTAALLGVMQSNNLIQVKSGSDDEACERSGSLIAIIGLQLLQVQSTVEKEGGTANDALQALTLARQLLPSALIVLNSDDISVSELVIDFLQRYVTLMRSSSEPEHVLFLAEVAKLCLARHVMPQELNPDGEGEDELEYNEYRKQLRSLANPIGTKRPQLVVEPLEGMLQDILSAGPSVEIRRVEALLHIVFSLGEIISSSFPQATKEKDHWLARAAELPLAMFRGIILDGRSSQVHIQYFENACRYDRIISTSSDIVAHIASAFLDERGIGSTSSKVRTRVVYLFVRFVKAQKQALGPHVSQIVPRIAPLLGPEAQNRFASEDQAFLYEVTATLIVFGNLDAQQRCAFFEELATTLATRFQNAINSLETARRANNKNDAQQAALELVAIVGYASRLTKAFSKDIPMALHSCHSIFMKLLSLFLESLTPVNDFLLESVRQYSHRLVVCINDELLSVLPLILHKFGGCSRDLDSTHHLLILCHQIVSKYGMKIVASGLSFGQILSSAARLTTDPAVQAKLDETAKRSLLYCQRAFAQLFYAVVSTETLTEFAPGETADSIVEAIRQLTYLNDSTTQKHCILSLQRCAILSITKNGGRWFEFAVRTILEAPTLPNMAPSDVGTQLVIHECGVSLLAIRAAATPQFDTVVNSLLPADMSERLLAFLASLKGKELDKAINQLYAPIRASQAAGSS